MAKKDSDKKTKEKKPEEKDSKLNTATDISDDADHKKEEPLEKPPEGEMFIKVYSPFKSYYDALATSITAENDTGPFDILAGHHKFLTLLSACEIEIRVKQGDGEKIKIDRGIMYVKEDRVTVFLDV